MPMRVSSLTTTARAGRSQLMVTAAADRVVSPGGRRQLAFRKQVRLPAACRRTARPSSFIARADAGTEVSPAQGDKKVRVSLVLPKTVASGGSAFVSVGDSEYEMEGRAELNVWRVDMDVNPG